MNASFSRPFIPWGPLATLIFTTHLAAQGPIPGSILPSGLELEIEEFVRIPNSHGGGSVPRMNFLTHPGDGSGRLFVCDERGEIWIIQGGAVLPTPFLDVSVARAGSFRSGGAVSGLGVRGLAFHPGYSNATSAGFGKVYISHIEFSTAGTPNLGPTALGDFDPDPDPGGCADIHGVVGEWSVDPTNANRLLPGSYREVLRMLHPCWDHSVKMVGFNPLAGAEDPDYELLYVAVGDAGSQNEGTGQDPKTPLGSILRIDPLATQSAPYSVPADNPFLSDPDALDELYAIGFRNPHRFTFTEGNAGQTRMILSDIGHSNVEEINEIVAGGNYGWRVREGTFVNTSGAISPLPPNDAQLGFTYPVAQYDHDDGRAVVGGFVYEGVRAPHLLGQYLFADFNNGRFFHVHVEDLIPGTQAVIRELTIVFNSSPTTFLAVVNSSRADTRFGLGEDGALYILNKRNGIIYRPTAHCAPPEVPTGLVVEGVISAVPTLVLNWGNGTEEPGGVTYNIYRSQGPFPSTYENVATRVTETTYTDTGNALTHFTIPAFDTTYFYRVTAVNCDGVESEPSALANGVTRFGGLRLPGDCNQDGAIDLSDPVCTLGVLFTGVPSLFPCGDGASTDPGNVALLDWQPDGGIDLSDVVAMLQFFFLGADPHPLAIPGAEATACVGTPGCTTSTECP